MSYIGRGTDKISNIEVLDNITFDGSSSYSITKSSVAFVPNSAQSCLISIDGVVQATNFTVSSSTIDFGTAVAGTSTCDFFLHYGTGLITTVSDGTVTTAKLGDASVTSAKLSAGKILQVVQGTTSTQVVTTSVGYVDTGLSASITPISSSNKILILVQQSFRVFENSDTVGGNIKLLRNTTDIYGDAQNYEIYMRVQGSVTGIQQYNSYSLNYLDSPSLTSSITYKTQQSSFASSDEFYTQPGSIDSSIILMEVSG